MKKRELRGRISFWHDMYKVVFQEFVKAEKTIAELRKIMYGSKQREDVLIAELKEAAVHAHRQDNEIDSTTSKYVDLLADFSNLERELKDTTNIADDRADQVGVLSNRIAGAYRALMPLRAIKAVPQDLNEGIVLENLRKIDAAIPIAIKCLHDGPTQTVADALTHMESVIAGYRAEWAEEHGVARPSFDPGYNATAGALVKEFISTPAGPRQPFGGFCKSLVGHPCLYGLDKQCPEGACVRDDVQTDEPVQSCAASGDDAVQPELLCGRSPAPWLHLRRFTFLKHLYAEPIGAECRKAREVQACDEQDRQAHGRMRMDR